MNTSVAIPELTNIYDSLVKASKREKKGETPRVDITCAPDKAPLDIFSAFGKRLGFGRSCLLSGKFPP
jgi:hypothetical protein